MCELKVSEALAAAHSRVKASIEHPKAYKAISADSPVLFPFILFRFQVGKAEVKAISLIKVGIKRLK